MSRALTVAQGRAVPSLEICSVAGGMNMVPLKLSIDDSKPASNAMQMGDCPYYSRVNDYIDADVLSSFNPYMKMGARGNLLRFANHDAKLYGLNLSWQSPLVASARWGKLTATGNAAYTRGKRSDSDGGGDLYRMMPFNALLGIEQAIGAWSNRIEARLVARKDKTDARRLELETGGYALVNLRSQVALNRLASLSFGVSNAFNRAYADPLGGVYLSGLQANGGALQSLPGEGRSIDVGLQLKF